MSKRAIEESFPIVEINRLAVPERNSFKPIYMMHKWFARRASCVFRGILLGALKPAGTDIMAEFYRDHAKDPDTQGKVVLDPFMGGGTTIVEALRLGCKVVGIDLNPVAWFVVKTQVEPVDVPALDAAFARLVNRPVAWSGKPLRDTLLDLYRTDAPWTLPVPGAPSLGASDVIYTYWVKSAPCTSPTCKKPVPLFGDYVVAGKKPTVRYHPDCSCPRCHKAFDWEIEPAALVADPRLMVHAASYSAGDGRATARWTYAHPDGGIFVAQGATSGGQGSVRHGQVPAGHVSCPHCAETVKPVMGKGAVSAGGKGHKPKRKKVPLTVLLCPHTEEVFQWRGELAEDARVTSPGGHEFAPYTGNLVGKGRFVCPHCGNNDAVIEAIRTLPETERLPVSAYAIHAYAPGCDPRFLRDSESDDNPLALDLTEETPGTQIAETENEDGDEDSPGIEITPPSVTVLRTQNLIWLQRGKFYTRHSPADLSRVQQADNLWRKNAGSLPHPKSEIPDGQETNRLHEHHYRLWTDMFLPRQLLAITTLFEAILAEPDTKLQDLLLCAFSNMLEANNAFVRQIASRSTPGGTAPAGILAMHGFPPKVTFCEQNVWGTVSGNNTYINRMVLLRDGIEYATKPYDGSVNDDGDRERVVGLDPLRNGSGFELLCGDSRHKLENAPFADVVITDPPYADNVNYSELADFFYVWLRLPLKARYPQFLPEYTPKTEEIVENDSRGKSLEDFQDGLTSVLEKSAQRLKPGGHVIFTFHHSGDTAWQSVLDSICRAGLAIEAVYPVHSEREASLHLQDKDNIAYDLVHVCRLRRPEEVANRRSWAGLKAQVRRRAQEEIRQIEAGRYGGKVLPPGDVRMVLIGKCLEVYSQHYGAVVDWQGEPMPLRAALQDIRLLVEQIASSEHPLPSELENTDAITQVWLLALADQREITVDSLSKTTRGVFEVSDLTDHKPPLLHKKRAKGSRSWAILTPAERLNGLREALMKAPPTTEQLDLGIVGGERSVVVGPPLVDVLHLLLACAETGERLDPLITFFDAQRAPLRAALEWLKGRDPDRWAKPCDLLLGFYSDVQLTSLISPTAPKTS
jgi:SAM-dependent methyltransferase